MADRDAFLASMTDEVGQLVLTHNYDQNFALANSRLPVGLDGRRARGLDGATVDQGLVDREIEFLPSTDAMEVRRANHKGLTSPELATLMAYTKIVLEDEILEIRPARRSYLADRLITYFPSRMREQYADQMREHRLHREIIATVVVNEFVNQSGITCFHRLSGETGAGAADVLRAQIAARAIFGAAKNLTMPSTHLITGRCPDADRAPDGSAHPGGAGDPLADQQSPASDRYRCHGCPVRRGGAGRPTRLTDNLAGREKEAFEQRLKSYLAAGVPDELATAIAVLAPARTPR